MPLERLKTFLNEQGIEHESITHEPRYTAQEIAASAHVPGKELAKTVIVKLDGKLAMAVLPATHEVALPEIRKLANTEKVELASEVEFQERFPDAEVGAMPPFGNLYGMETYVAESLAEDETITFNARSHTELLRISYDDFERTVRPKVGPFARKP